MRKLLGLSRTGVSGEGRVEPYSEEGWLEGVARRGGVIYNIVIQNILLLAIGVDLDEL